MFRSLFHRSRSYFITFRGFLETRRNNFGALYLHTSFIKLRSIENEVKPWRLDQTCCLAASYKRSQDAFICFSSRLSLLERGFLTVYRNHAVENFKPKHLAIELDLRVGGSVTKCSQVNWTDWAITFDICTPPPGSPVEEPWNSSGVSYKNFWFVLWLGKKIWNSLEVKL